MINRPRKRKAILIIVTILLVCIAGFSVLFSGPSVKYVPDGYTNKKEYMNPFAIQDFTDFCIYQYSTDDVIENYPGYQEMTSEDAEAICGYFDDFYNWLDSEKLQEQCLLAQNSVSAGDFCRIDTREGEPVGDGIYGKYDDYSVWFFDVETATLYYIHNNI